MYRMNHQGEIICIHGHHDPYGYRKTFTSFVSRNILEQHDFLEVAAFDIAYFEGEWCHHQRKLVTLDQIRDRLCQVERNIWRGHQ